MPKLYLITGPAGAGKTTLAQKMIAEGKAVCHYEADQWMVDHKGNYSFNPKCLYFCHKSCQNATDIRMSLGNNVIVSNTTLTKKEARPYIDLAKKYGYDVEIIHLETQFQSVHGVPEWKVKEMQEKREKFTLADFN